MSIPSDDIARAVLANAKEEGVDVPRDQFTRLQGEIARLCDGHEIGGYTRATLDGASPTVFAIVDNEGYLLRWADDALAVTWLGRLPRLRYVERTRAIGGQLGFEGDPLVQLELQHERLPGKLIIEAERWLAPELNTIRVTLRSWAGET